MMSVSNNLDCFDMDENDFDWNDLGELLDETESLTGHAGPASAVTVQASKAKVVKSSSTRKSKPAFDMKPLKRLIFPRFDKSDSTIFFPSTFARLINNGDITTLHKLMKSHLSKKCDVSLSCDDDFAISLPRFITLLNTGLVTLPDIMVCMHDTRIVGNQIQAELYLKYTDEPEMYNYPQTEKFDYDPFLKAIFTGKRKDLLAHNMQLNQQSEEKRQEIMSVIDLNERVQVYGKITLVLTFDDITKKVTNFKYIGRLNALSHNGEMYRTI